MMKQLNFHFVLMLMSYMATWTAAIKHLHGIKCSDKKEGIEIPSYNVKLGDLCSDLDIKIW